jgi:hypothetical protein
MEANGSVPLQLPVDEPVEPPVEPPVAPPVEPPVDPPVEPPVDPPLGGAPRVPAAPPPLEVVRTSCSKIAANAPAKETFQSVRPAVFPVDRG